MDDYEKKYKEALRQIKECTPDENGFVTIYPNEIFPELKESEDERIRKEIITYLSTVDDKELIPYESWIAWLEKQGELVNSLSKGLDNAHERIDGLIQKNNSLIEQLEEKQGEQKSADNVEPKFNEGDWLVYNKPHHNPDICKVVEITDELCRNYSLDSNDIKDNSIEFMKYNYRLWTLQDAKDGDVLVDKYGNIGIYQGDKNAVTWHSYCYCGVNEEFYGEGSHEFPCHPATKEQRDTLMKAMAGAGYTFNFEKKELKKIEQKTEEYNITGIGSKNAQGKLGEMIKNLKPAWSEEDEDYYDAIITKLEVTKDDVLLTDNQMEFLKSLKDKYVPQSKQEWSEEDREKLSECCSIIKQWQDAQENYYFEQRFNYSNWLKSLIPRSQWKPSDEQMEALESATENCAYSEYQDCLRELIKQLKKLREE